MAKLLFSELDELRIIYKEIVDGYSFSDDSNLFVKHLTELELTDVTRKKSYLFKKYQQEGLPTEEERLKLVIDTEEWSKEKEEEILQCKYTIADNEKNLKILIPQQQGAIKTVLEQEKRKLLNLLRERRYIIGVTADEVAGKESNNYYIYLSLFKDASLKERFFESWEDVAFLEDEEILKYSNIADEVSEKLTVDCLKKVSILPIFINPLRYVQDNVSMFFGKPMVQLSQYQLLLIILGLRNVNILDHADGKPPELLDDVKLQDIVDWYDKSYSIMLGKRNSHK